ncbi:GNAT family N-acetyltransferase [Clostridium sp. AL.422]|uniref:GNAT family N-acetyltransferase n=1 Tax=Clostridium TaxID=1485 RepID=UPI00293DFB21|nr:MULTISPECIES: GNAT family N-acetyltransferase [unclassified Clostridium]MDV4150538.1 GNAT family N-acetyltransferase [Clostridium sp. AL.422]
MNKEEIIRKELRLIVRELGLLNRNCLNSDMTLVQAHILNYLKQNGETPFNELLINLGIDKASLSRIINNLETKNYLEMKKSETDKRMKEICILPLGMEAINDGDYKANKFINEILNLGDSEDTEDIIRAFRVFRILALKNNLNKNDSRILIERISENYMSEAIKLATEVFNNEQSIPVELIPVNDNLKPIWWCARVGEDIIGVTAAWQEKDKWHWGRFAVDKRLRGMGIGQKLAIFSLKEIFNSYTEEVYIEARDATVNMLMKFRCEVIGEAENFYVEPVTPIILNKSNFFASIKSQK